MIYFISFDTGESEAYIIWVSRDLSWRDVYPPVQSADFYSWFSYILFLAFDPLVIFDRTVLPSENI